MIGCAITIYEKSDTFISLIKLLRSEIEQKNIEPEELNFKHLFRVFVKQRNIKLLRYFFNMRANGPQID